MNWTCLISTIRYAWVRLKRFHFTKVGGKGDLLLWCQGLVPEYQKLVFSKSVANGVEGVRVSGNRQVDS